MSVLFLSINLFLLYKQFTIATAFDKHDKNIATHKKNENVKKINGEIVLESSSSGSGYTEYFEFIISGVNTKPENTKNITLDKIKPFLLFCLSFTFLENGTNSASDR